MAHYVRLPSVADPHNDAIPRTVLGGRNTGIQNDEPAPQIEDAFVLEFEDRRDGPRESSDLSSGFGVCLVSVFVIVRYGLSGIPRDWRTGLALCYQCVTIKMA